MNNIVNKEKLKHLVEEVRNAIVALKKNIYMEQPYEVAKNENLEKLLGNLSSEVAAIRRELNL